jgi:hypothetical protein
LPASERFDISSKKPATRLLRRFNQQHDVILRPLHSPAVMAQSLRATSLSRPASATKRCA